MNAMKKSEWEKHYGMKWGGITKSPKLQHMEETIAAQVAEIGRLKEFERLLKQYISNYDDELIDSRDLKGWLDDKWLPDVRDALGVLHGGKKGKE